MSTEILSAGSPFIVKALDRTFGGRSNPPHPLVISDGLPSTDPGRVPLGGDLGNILQGGRTVMGDAAVTSVSLTATNTATLQLRDCGGNAHLGIRTVKVWLSTTAGGTTAPGTTGLTTTVTTGGIIDTITANLSFLCVTDATGKLVVQAADATGGETRFVNFAVDDKIFTPAALVSPP